MSQVRKKSSYNLQRSRGSRGQIWPFCPVIWISGTFTGLEWLLYVVTVCLAAGFTIAGFYALAAAGDIRKLPLRRLVMIAIVGLYSIRVIVGIGWLLYEFTYLQFFSTLVPAFLVYCYLPGLKRDVNNQMLP